LLILNWIGVIYPNLSYRSLILHLTNEAVSHVPIAQWLAAIQEVALQNPKLDDALRDRLVRAIAELNAIAECLEETRSHFLSPNMF
jgi:hypothetical protein